MHERIKELSEGIFERFESVLLIPEEAIEIELAENQNYQGEFLIRSANQMPVKGSVFSTSERMQCSETLFEGEGVSIRFQFHSVGLVEGDIHKGDFYIVCEQGEYNLSFVVTIINPFLATSDTAIHTSADLAELAREHWEAARKIFLTEPFFVQLRRQDAAQAAAYDLLRSSMHADLAMEEFLTAAGAKERIVISAESQRFQLSDVDEDTVIKLRLHKNTWGYVSLKLRNESDFLSPSKQKLGQSDFMGNICDLEVCIEHEKMHPGWNYGTIILEDALQELEFQFEIHRKRRRSNRTLHKSSRRKQELEGKLLELYEAYRMNRPGHAKWAFESVRIYDELMILFPENAWYQVLKSQTLLMNGQRQDAEQSLQQAKHNIDDRLSPQWAYYLYVSTLMNREKIYIDKVSVEFEEIYLHHQENMYVFYSRLFLHDSYLESPAEKLKYILKFRKEYGGNSVLLLNEIYFLYDKEPYLIHQINQETVVILIRAVRRGFLSKQVIERIMELGPGKMDFSPLLMELLEGCYRIQPGDELVASACSILIKSQQNLKKYFIWLERGIEHNVRIAGLYEAYLQYFAFTEKTDFPKTIMLYFKYHAQLDSRRKALLYARMVQKQKEEKILFSEYLRYIEEFALEQISLGNLDDNLAVLYNEIMPRFLEDKKVMEQFQKLAFSHKIYCNNTKMAKVILYQKSFLQPFSYPLIHGTAYFQLVAKEYRIVFEDAFGNRYANDVEYDLMMLISPVKYLKKALSLNPELTNYQICFFDRHAPSDERIMEYVDTVGSILHNISISTEYKVSLILKYLGHAEFKNMLPDLTQMLRQIDPRHLTEEEKRGLCTLIFEQKLSRTMKEFLKRAAFERLPNEMLLWFCDARIQEIGYEYDEELVKLSGRTFRNGRQSDSILTYLGNFLEAPVIQLNAVLKKMEERNLNRVALEERLMIQMLSTGAELDEDPPVYTQIMESLDHPMLKMAYFNKIAYRYVSDGILPNSKVMDQLYEWYRSNSRLLLICRVALLKYHCEYLHKTGRHVLSQTDTEKFLSECIRHGMKFAFFNYLDKDLQRRYQIYGHTILEFHAREASSLTLFYRKADTEDEFVSEPMEKVYYTIFLKDFLLFSGEGIQYYIKKEGQEETILEEGILSRAKDPDPDSMDCFDRIDRIVRYQNDHDTDRAEEEWLELLLLSEICKSEFSIIQ
ncbi:MAG: DUF5717 family protein [Lachnospiraceae bacterium]